MVKNPSAGHASDPFNQNFWLQAQTPDLLKLPVGPTEQPRPKLSTSHSLEWQFSIVQLISFVFYFYLFIYLFWQNYYVPGVEWHCLDCVHCSNSPMR